MKRHLPILLMFVCAATFAFGVLQLFRLRYEAGDVYPEYSSLRSDPLGTMAFYESLEKMPGVSVRRDFSSANQLPEGRESVYLHLAAQLDDWSWMPESLFQEIERFVRSGGRLAITAFPEGATGYHSRWDDSKTNAPSKMIKGGKEIPSDKKSKADPQKPKHKKRGNPFDEDREGHWINLSERWGVRFRILDLDHTEAGIYEPALVENRSDEPLPETLAWHSGVVLTNLDAAWKIIYQRGSNAVVAERKFGRGSVVIATDSYFLSNEAMLKDRHAGLLAWLIGGNHQVVFDEAHLGVAEQPGVATLMRKYRLHWLTAGLILLAGLFVWKNSMSLVPPHANEARQDYVPGKDAGSGFVNLLRRSIPARELLATCFNEWQKSAARSGRYSSGRLQQAEAIFQAETSLPPKSQDPFRAYDRIHRVLESHKPEGSTPPDL